MTRIVLCLNSGSSSLKFALFRMGKGAETMLSRGAVERIGLGGGHLWMRGPDGGTRAGMEGKFRNYASALRSAFEALEGAGFPRPEAAGHRIVHGGPERTGPELVDEELVRKLRNLIPYAPLHLPGEIEIIEAVFSRYPGLPQVACFDTTFHRSMPEVAQRFPLPARLWDQGIRRYGFHGLSYEYIMSTFGEEFPPRIIIAHLGNGASMAAVKDGRCIDTTMGFTPTGGFMMGTRSGDLDPGMLLYLMNELGFDSRTLERMVNYEAGLFGVSGISPDMKTLLSKRKSAHQADLAVEMFCFHLRKQVGALSAAIEGLDTLVFTGGIGERAAPVRAMVCDGLAHLGISIDPETNSRHEKVISDPASRCTVRVIPTNEDLVIARHTWGMTAKVEP